MHTYTLRENDIFYAACILEHFPYAKDYTSHRKYKDVCDITGHAANLVEKRQMNRYNIEVHAVSGKKVRCCSCKETNGFRLGHLGKALQEELTFELGLKAKYNLLD